MYHISIIFKADKEGDQIQWLPFYLEMGCMSMGSRVIH